MCGRYTLFTEKEQRELYNIIQEVEEKLNPLGMKLKKGEIHPTNLAPILVGQDKKVLPEGAIWGFPHFQEGGVIINARADTAPTNKLFAQSFHTRCVVPCTGFYEWKRKTKYLFELENEVIYMAGVVNTYKDEKRYVILTTDANDSMKATHNRMPVILQKEEIEKWLWDYQFAVSILNRVPVQLIKKAAEHEQLTFGDVI